jgi:high-affinity nickel permease
METTSPSFLLRISAAFSVALITLLEAVQTEGDGLMWKWLQWLRCCEVGLYLPKIPLFKYVYSYYVYRCMMLDFEVGL